jgi:hypothetical protein
MYVLNHISDRTYLSRTKELIAQYGQTLVELPFNNSQYRNLSSAREKVIYAININRARNQAIKYAVNHGAEFIFCFDQECYCEPDELNQIIAEIHADQASSPARQYYGLIMKRFVDGAKPDPDSRNEEPQIIFRSDASTLFDESIPFGDNDKRQLLYWLGYGSEPDYHVNGVLCRTIGTVWHLSFGNPELEVDMKLRVAVRRQSIADYINALDQDNG